MVALSATLAALLFALPGAAPAWLGLAPPARVPLAHIHTIVIDPGHGGSNHGCLGVDGTYEKVVTLEIAKRIARIIAARTSARALLTRHGDRFVGLRQRTRMANAWGADVFLSIHLNADPYGRGEGVETWFLSSNSMDAEARRLVAREDTADEVEPGSEADVDPLDQSTREAVDGMVRDARIHAAQAASEALATSVAMRLHLETGATLRGVKQAHFGVLEEATMPAIVVECGFFTNDVEGPKLLTPAYQERIARAIVDGIIAYDHRIGGAQLAGTTP